MKTDNKIFNVLSTQQELYTIEEQVVNDKSYMVVPVVMMVEGVHSGSGGAIFYPERALATNVSEWNEVPLFVRHPKNSSGEYVSAEGLDSLHVGFVKNTVFVDGKLKAQAWIDSAQLADLSPETLEILTSGSPLDVSTGMFMQLLTVQGVWNNEPYYAIATGFLPDHLALLPDEEGACNWNDGCGVRVNSKSSTQKSKSNEMTDVDALKALNKDGFSVAPVVNELSFDAITSFIYDHVNALDNDMRVAYVESIYENFFVYRVRSRDSHRNNTTTMYRQTYTVNDQDQVVLEGDPAEVRKIVSYETLQQQMQRTKFNRNSKNKDMDVKEKVDQLISNGRFSDCDRTWLSTLSVEALSKIEQTAKAPEKSAAPEQRLDVNAALTYLKENTPASEQVLGLLSAEDKAVYEQGKKAIDEQRTASSAIILANSKQWNEDELKAMPLDLLTKIANSFQKEEVDYSGQAAGGLNTNAKKDDDVLLPMHVHASPNKK